MRKILVAGAIAGLALAMGPPAMAQASPALKQFQDPVLLTDVLSPVDAAFTARAVYHPADQAVVDMKVSEKSAGRKKATDDAKDKRDRQDRAAAPRYPLLL